MCTQSRLYAVAAAFALSLTGFAACGSDTNLVSDDGGTGSPSSSADADPNAPDANPECASNPQCSNCIDDDGDGLIDGFDPECISGIDDREDSFATGIPGDNIDGVKQDCFFDGNSGSGDDGCDIHVCCLLSGECPADLGGPPFNPASCPQSQECIDNCAPLTPPGCDCFGCCTICDDTGCYDILTNPAVAPDCGLDVIADAAQCPRCSKTADCGGGDCVAARCELCPGQTADDLPADCVQQVCPGGLTVCTAQSDCAANQFCSNGCCIVSVD